MERTYHQKPMEQKSWSWMKEEPKKEMSWGIEEKSQGWGWDEPKEQQMYGYGW